MSRTNATCRGQKPNVKDSTVAKTSIKNSFVDCQTAGLASGLTLLSLVMAVATVPGTQKTVYTHVYTLYIHICT